MDDAVRYHRVAQTPGLILSEGRYREQAFERHYHLDYHIGLVCDGLQRQEYGGNRVLLGPGSISVMPPGEMHDGHGEGDAAFTLRTFRIEPALLHGLGGELAGGGSAPQLAPQSMAEPRLFRQLLTLHQELQHGVDLLVQEERWLSVIGQLLQPGDAADGAAGRRFSMRDWQRVSDFCHAHYESKISIDQLAQLCGLGRFQFLRQFKNTVGMTPHAWLTRLRLERACAALRQGGRLVADVAQESGFYDQSHFNRAFRLAYGVPPSRY